MNFILKKLIFITLIFYSYHSFSEDKTSQEFSQNPKNYSTKLEIISKNSEKISEFFVAIADSEDKRINGLMNLKSLPKKNGMLFIFEKPEIVQMWMKNTLLPLDMLFIKGDSIVQIFTNSKPLSKDIISSIEIVDKVIEINAGEVKKQKIKLGDKIRISK